MNMVDYTKGSHIIQSWIQGDGKFSGITASGEIGCSECAEDRK